MMSLRSVQKLSDAVQRRPAEIEEDKQKGKKVFGWIGYLIPEEIIHASGMIPLRLGRGGDEKEIEVGTRYISFQNCAFIRACAGMFADHTDPYFSFPDAIAYDTTCMQIFRLGEVSKYFFKTKSIFLGIPKNLSTAHGQKYFESELEHFTRKLEHLSGHEIPSSNIQKSIRLYQEIRRSIKKLYTCVSLDQTPLSWKELHGIIHAGYYLDRELYLALVQDVIGELESLSLSQECQSKKPRIVLAGSPLLPGDNKLLEIIETSNGRVVSDLLWSDCFYLGEPDIQSSTISGIAQAYMQMMPHHSIPCISKDEDQRLNRLKKVISESNASGVIYHTMRFCDSAAFKVPDIKNKLNDINIPLLEIHTEYSHSDIEAIRTRIEAFIELLSFNQKQMVST